MRLHALQLRVFGFILAREEDHRLASEIKCKFFVAECSESRFTVSGYDALTFSKCVIRSTLCFVDVFPHTACASSVSSAISAPASVPRRLVPLGFGALPSPHG
jgi:hypothetical protein